MKELIEVSRGDLDTLCRAILENYVDCDNGGSFGSQRDFCRFCCAHIKHPSGDVFHTLDCPVVIATDVAPRQK